MFSKASYLQELLRRYQANFDITENYTIGGKTYPAYAWFYSFSEKYVLKKEAQLWAIKAYEHVLFSFEDDFTVKDLEELKSKTISDIEPVLVRNGNKYPEKDHMCSYITYVIIASKTPDAKTQKAIRRFSFDKGYLMNFRGHSEVKLAVVSMESESVYTNRAGKDLKEIMKDVFSKASDSEKAAS